MGMFPVAGFPSAGGGTSLAGLPFESIDLTDGWTLYDPDSLIDTSYGTSGVTHSSGTNTIKMAALGSGSNDYVWTTGATSRAPRWYKLLAVSGAQVTAETRSTILV